MKCFTLLMVLFATALARAEGRDDGRRDAPPAEKQALAALEKAGARFDKGPRGVVTGVILGSKTTDDTLVYLASLPHLETLRLQCALKVTDDGLSHLEGLTGLRRLWFGYTNITDVALVHLQNLANLQELHIGVYRSEFKDPGLVYLKGLKKLESLSLNYAKVSDKAVQDLQESLPHCKIEVRRTPPKQ
jgi:hypothetical protein